MKRFLMLVGVAIVAGAMYVAASPASQQAKKPKAPTAKQFNALKKQVASLSKSLKALKADETKVKADATAAAGFLETCFVNVAPISQFGSPSDGFLFGTSVTNAPRTALDIDSSTTPDALIQMVEPICVTSSTAKHTLHGRFPLRAERSH